MSATVHGRSTTARHALFVLRGNPVTALAALGLTLRGSSVRRARA